MVIEVYCGPTICALRRKYSVVLAVGMMAPTKLRDALTEKTMPSWEHTEAPIVAHQPPPHRPLSPSLTVDMALPRSNYDPRRVCINPFPNISLGKHRRTIGIYLAGGLVRSAAPLAFRQTDLPAFSFLHPSRQPVTWFTATVCSRELDVPRCRNSLRTRPFAVRGAADSPARPRLLRRLATRHLFPLGNDRHQPHRQGPSAGT